MGGLAESQHLFALAVDFVGPEDALRALQIKSVIFGLHPVPTGGFFGGEQPPGPTEDLPGLAALISLHVQAFPKGVLARAGVTFPTVS